MNSKKRQFERDFVVTEVLENKKIKMSPVEPPIRNDAQNGIWNNVHNIEAVEMGGIEPPSGMNCA